MARVPVDYDPFAEEGRIPVDYDPFAGEPAERATFGEVASTIGKGLRSAVVDIFPKTLAEATRAGDVPLNDVSVSGGIIREQKADIERRQLPAEVAQKKTIFGLNLGDIKAGLENLGYSGASAIGGMVAGAATTPIPHPLAKAAGAAIGAATLGGATAYRATKDQFVSDMRDRAVALKPEITEKEWGAIRASIENDAQLYGMWEAFPEAAGNAVMAGLIKVPGASYVAKLPFVKNGVARALISATGKVGLAAGSELATEGKTAQKQSEIEARHGLRTAPLESWGAGVEEVAAQTMVTTLATMGLGSVASRLTSTPTPDREATPPPVNKEAVLGKVSSVQMDPAQLAEIKTRLAPLGITPEEIDAAHEGGATSRFEQESLRYRQAQFAKLNQAKTADEAIAAFQSGISPVNRNAEMDRLLGEYSPEAPVFFADRLFSEWEQDGIALQFGEDTRHLRRLALPAPEGVTYGEGFEMRPQEGSKTIIRRVGEEPQGDYVAGVEQSPQVIYSRPFKSKNGAIASLNQRIKSGSLNENYDVVPTKDGMWRIESMAPGQIGEAGKTQQAQEKQQSINELARGNPVHAMVQDIRKAPLNLDQIRQDYGPETIAQINKKFPGIFSEKGTTAPDEAAEMHGYEGTDQLIEALKSAPTIKESLQKYAEPDRYESVDKLVADGLDPVFEKMPAGNLTQGDEIEVGAGSIAPADRYKVKGYENGQVVLKDGLTVKVDPWDELNIEGRKATGREMEELPTKISDLPTDPAHVAEGMDNPDNALDFFEAAIPQEDRATMADVFDHIRKNGLHRQTSFAQQLFNMVGGMYSKRTGKQLAILGGNADNIGKEAPNELTTEAGRVPGASGDQGTGAAGPGAGARSGVSGDAGQAGGGPAGTERVNTPDASDASAPSGVSPTPPAVSTQAAEPVSATAPASSPITIEPHGSGIIVFGDRAQVRAKLADAGVKPKGLPNAKLGGLVFTERQAVAVRAALKEKTTNAPPVLSTNIDKTRDKQTDIPLKETPNAQTDTADTVAAVAEAKPGDDAGLTEPVFPSGAKSLDDVEKMLSVGRLYGTIMLDSEGYYRWTPHGLRPGQSARDLFENKPSEFVWLGAPGWYDTDAIQRVSVKLQEAIGKENLPANRYDFTSLHGLDLTPQGAIKAQPSQGARKITAPQQEKVEESRDMLRAAVGNPDLVGKQRADTIANLRNLTQFWEANSPEKVETGYERGDQVAYTGETTDDGFRKFIYLEGSNAGAEGVAATKEQKSSASDRAKQEWKDQQEGFGQVREQVKKTTETYTSADANVKKTGEKDNMGRPAAEMTAAELLRAAADKMEGKDDSVQPDKDSVVDTIASESTAEDSPGSVATPIAKDEEADKSQEVTVSTETDKGERLYSKTGEKNLYVAHNLSTDNLRHALDLGGLAAPSLAVGNIDTSAFTAFGEITLLADPGLLFSPKTKTFDADVYSPRHPQAVHVIDRGKLDKLVSSFGDTHGLETPGEGDLEESRGLDRLKHNDAFKLAWLREQGINLPLKKEIALPAVRKIAGMQGGRYELEQNTEVVKIAQATAEKDLAKMPGRVKEDMRDLWFGEDGKVKRRYVSDLVSKAIYHRDTGGVDWLALRQAISKKFRDSKLSARFEEHARKTFDSLVKERKIFKGFSSNSGNRRYSPYTLDNIVNDMTRDLRGGEGFNYGAGSVRSAFARQFKSIAEMQKHRDRVVSKEEMDKIKEESQQKLSDLLDELRPFYKYESGSFGYMDDASQAIAEGYRGIRDAFKDLPSDMSAKINDFTTYLKNLPTEYFEAKMQRAVNISEFNAAVVPRGVPDDLVQALKDKGLAVRFYKKGDEADRLKAVRNTATLFSKTTTKTGTTVAQVETELRTFLKRGYDKLTGSGKLRVVQSVAELQGGESLLSSKATESDAFKKWFGNSKVVDERGEPLEVYHATRKDFEEFKPGGFDPTLSGPGIWFVDKSGREKPPAAHTAGSYNPVRNTYPDGYRVIPAHLKIERPLLLDDGTMLDWAREVFADGSRDFPHLLSQDAVDALKDAGYDGIVWDHLGVYPNKTIKPGEIPKEYIVFDPVQVKSVFNSGAFSETDPRILYSKDGSIAGTYDPRTGQITIVADNVKPGQAEYVMLHEGLHSLMREDAIFTKQHDAILDRLEELKATDYRVKDAFRRVPDDTPAHLVREEALAYFIESKANHETSLFKKLIANIRMWLMRMGIPMKNLTTDDLVAMVVQGVKRLANQERVADAGGTIGELAPAMASVNQTRTKAFKKWFGDSVVVDENGEPLIVYHGTRRDFNSFESMFPMGALGNPKGVYFTADKRAAEEYAQDVDGAWDERSRVIAAYLSINSDADGMIRESTYGGTEYVIFDPTKIKSATGNTGAFSAQSDDIRYSKATSPSVVDDIMAVATGKVERQEKNFDEQVFSSERTPAETGEEDLPEETKSQAFQRRMQDRYNRFGVVEDWLKKQGVKLSELASVSKRIYTMNGRIADQLKRFMDGDIADLAKNTAEVGSNMAEIEEYLLAKHAAEANEQVRILYGDAGRTAYGITDKAAKEILQKYEGRNNFAEFEKVAEGWRGLSDNTLDMLLKEGIVSQESYDAMRSKYQHYVPVIGEEEGVKSGGKGFRVKSGLKRRGGHEARNERVIENIIKRREFAIHQIEKNRVSLSVAQMLIEAGDERIGTVDRPEKIRAFSEKTAYVVNFKDAVAGVFASEAEADRFIDKALAKRMGKLEDYFINTTTDPAVTLMVSPMLADNEISAYINGHRMRIQLNDEVLARAATNFGVERVSGILEVGRQINNYLSRIYTGYDPRFTIRNTIRDFTAGVINMTGDYGVGVAAKIVANYPRAMAEFVKGRHDPTKSKHVDGYRKAGGSTGASWLSSLDRVGADVQKMFEERMGAVATYQKVYAEQVADGVPQSKAHMKAAFRAGLAGGKRIPIAGHFLRMIEAMNAVSENAFRLSVYMTLKEEKKSDMEAGEAAKTSTINFDKRGELGPQLGAMWLFYNPTVQGMQRTLFALTQSEHKHQAQALVGAMALLGYTLASAAGDDWDEVPMHVKNRNLVVSLGGKTFATIPLPYEYGSFVGIGYAIADAVNGKSDGKTWTNLASTIVEGLSPFGNPILDDGTLSPFQMLPTVPLMAVAPTVNENSFGSQISPTKYKEWAPDAQTMWRTTHGTVYDKVATRLNELTGGNKYQQGALDVSPETLKFYTNGLLGGAYTFIQQVTEIGKIAGSGSSPEINEIPMANVLLKEISVKDSRAAFYEQARKIKMADAEYKAALKDKNYAVARDIAKEKASLIKHAKLITSMAKLSKAKRDELDRIRTDDKLSFAQKREKMRVLEKMEQGIYDRFTSQQ